MKKSEILKAVSNVFGAEVVVVTGYWNFCIKTTPAREIVFLKEFVSKYVGQDILKMEDLENALRNIPEHIWQIEADGKLLLTSFEIERQLAQSVFNLVT